jgi:AcrR family transcriptional regulator
MTTRTRATRAGSARESVDSYHHGQLRTALLDAAEAMLAEGGLEAFTLRECARRAGVSHAAPAHHFGDARGLLSACAASGFVRLADTMERYAARAAGPVEAVRGVGQAYVDFALHHRALFQLMFRRDRLDPDHAELKVAGKRTGDLLRRVIDALIVARDLPAEERGRRILLAWSLVHGYATLVLEDQCAGLFGLSAAQFRPASRMGDELLRLLETGLVAPAAQDNPPTRSPSSR